MQAGDYSSYLTGRADDEREAWQAQRGDCYTGPAEGASDAAGLSERLLLREVVGGSRFGRWLIRG